MINIIIHGCNGSMGKAITNIVSKDSNIKIVAGIDPDVNQSNPYPVFSNIEECNIEADIIIDFSTASAIKGLLEYVDVKKIPVVICTTGISSDDINHINKVSLNTPVFFSANMSLGINLLIGLAKRSVEILGDSGFDIEIIEKHHNQKIDAPSGTALAIADGINDATDNSYSYQYDRSKLREKRNPREIGIHAIRGGTIVGDHDVIFAGQDEVITLSHTASSKEVFAVGAVKAAKFMYANKDTPGLYDMENLINN